LREPTLEEMQEAVGGYISLAHQVAWSLSGLMVLNEKRKNRGFAL
jgi:hypothetical protein